MATKDKPTPSKRTTRPALDILDADQGRLLFHGDDLRDPPFKPLRGGFDSLWQLLVWYQAAGIRTLGHIEAILPPSKIQPNRPVVAYLLLEKPESDYVRQRLVESVDQACDIAYADLKERAEELVGEDENQSSALAKIDDSDREIRETNPAMRPAFRKLDEQQSVALRSLFAGFDDRTDVSQWVRGLTAPTAGEKPDGLMADIIRSKPLLRALLDETDDAMITRYRFAVTKVLPAFLSGARTLRGGERSDTETGFGPRQG